jgi:hypothetical protein
MPHACAVALVACALSLSFASSVTAHPPIYTTAGRYQPKFLPPSWKTYQNYRGDPGYNVRRRSDEHRRMSPKYSATSTYRLYQY